LIEAWMSGRDNEAAPGFLQTCPTTATHARFSRDAPRRKSVTSAAVFS
jgi:hypothetical protein